MVVAEGVVVILVGGSEKGTWIKYQGYLVPSSTESGKAEEHFAAMQTVKNA